MNNSIIKKFNLLNNSIIELLIRFCSAIESYFKYMKSVKDSKDKKQKIKKIEKEKTKIDDIADNGSLDDLINLGN